MKQFLNQCRMIRSLPFACQRFIGDQRGSVNSLSTIFLTVVLALGLIVGLVCLRDQVAQEFGDVSVGLDSLDQSFSYEIVVDGQTCIEAEYIDPGATLTDPIDQPPAGLTLDLAPTGENGTRPAPSGGFP